MSDFIGAGWTFPLGTSATGEIALLGGTAKIEQAMRIILSTYPGERPMRPAWGSKLRDFVFAETNETNIAAIGRVVRKSIENWEPRAKVADVDVYLDKEKPGLVYIDILYTVVGENSERNLVFPFYTIPEQEEGED